VLRSLSWASWVLAVLAGSAAGGASHVGKVVRVVSRAGKPAGAPRFCEVSPNDCTGSWDRPVSTDRVIGIDSDGDGEADRAFLAFGCDDAGQPTTNLGMSMCIEAWYAVDAKWQLLRVDRVQSSCP
jgi:hypothetical protein